MHKLHWQLLLALILMLGRNVSSNAANKNSRSGHPNVCVEALETNFSAKVAVKNALTSLRRFPTVLRVFDLGPPKTIAQIRAILNKSIDPLFVKADLFGRKLLDGSVQSTSEHLIYFFTLVSKIMAYPIAFIEAVERGGGDVLVEPIKDFSKEKSKVVNILNSVGDISADTILDFAKVYMNQPEEFTEGNSKTISLRGFRNFELDPHISAGKIGRTSLTDRQLINTQIILTNETLDSRSRLLLRVERRFPLYVPKVLKDEAGDPFEHLNLEASISKQLAFFRMARLRDKLYFGRLPVSDEVIAREMLGLNRLLSVLEPQPMQSKRQSETQKIRQTRKERMLALAIVEFLMTEEGFSFSELVPALQELRSETSGDLRKHLLSRIAFNSLGNKGIGTELNLRIKNDKSDPYEWQPSQSTTRLFNESLSMLHSLIGSDADPGPFVSPLSNLQRRVKPNSGVDSRSKGDFK